MKYNSINPLVLFVLLVLFSCPAQSAELEWNATDKETWDHLVKEGGELYKKQEFARAIPIERQALDLAEKNVGTNHPDTAENYNALGLLYSLTKDYATADAFFTRALAIFEKTPDLKDDRQVFENRCEMFYYMAAFAKAEESCNQLLDILGKIYGPDHPASGNALVLLGNTYLAEGQLDKAEPLFKRALNMYPNADATAMIMGFLGTTYMLKHDSQNAEKYLAQALPNRERSLGPDNSVVLKLTEYLAGAYADQGKYALAAPLYERLVAAYEKIPPLDNVNLGRNLRSLGVVYIGESQYEKGISTLNRALTIHEKLDPNSLEVVYDLGRLVSAYVVLKEFDKAEADNRQALVIVESSLGNDAPLTTRIRNDLERIHEERARSNAENR